MIFLARVSFLWLVRIQYRIPTYIIYEVCVNQLFMVLMRLLLNSRLLVKFWGSQKLYMEF